MTTAEDIDARYQPTRTRATICMDSDLVLAIARLEQDMAAAAGDTSAASPERTIAQQVVDLREQVKAAEVEFVFRSLGRHAYREMLRAHPATEAQQTEVSRDNPDARLIFNPDTFMPALLAASCESPTGTDLAWWTRKCAEWGEGQIARLWEACSAAQAGVTAVPKAERAYALTRTPEQSSE